MIGERDTDKYLVFLSNIIWQCLEEFFYASSTTPVAMQKDCETEVLRLFGLLT